MSPLYSLLIVFLPLPILILIARLRVKRQRRTTGAGVAEKKTFEPAPEPPTNLLLRQFSLVERVYIRQQIPTARTGVCIISWLVFCAMTPSLFPDIVHRYQSEQSLPMAVWYCYLRASIVLGWFSVVIAIITAGVTGVGLTGKLAQTTFFRTRPLTYRLLFWGRVLPALGTLLVGYAIGLTFSLGLLVALHGPVWKHLDISGLTMLQKLSRSHELVWLLRSPWVIFISIAVSMVCIFSAAIAFALQPFRFPKMPKLAQSLVGIVVYMTFSFLGAHQLLPKLAHFGVIPGSSIGPPPSTDLFLLALSAALLWSAQIAASRKEN